MSPGIVRPKDTDFVIYGPDNQPVKTVPTFFLELSDAMLFHRYNAMMADAELEVELYCRQCGHDKRELMCEVEGEGGVAIACGCKVRMYDGPVPAEPVTPMVQATQLVGPDLVGGVSLAVITEPAARLFRLWKRFLTHYDLQEAVRCARCFDRDLADGCSASVNDRAIRLQCRCTVRTFTGTTG